MTIIILTVTAFLFSILLVLVDSKLNKQEKVEEEYLKYLPGYNCGACGLGSCTGMADAMVKDPTAYQRCKPLRGKQKEEMEAYLRKMKKI